MAEIIHREFYCRPGTDVARDLIGKVLVRSTPESATRGIIVECEAYLGRIDPAAHSYKGMTERTRVLFGEKGHAYVYLIYGMYRCLNISVGLPEAPECVLIRALEPVAGLDVMARRRGTTSDKKLCSGPGKLCMAMDVGAAQYGADLCGESDGLWLEYGDSRPTVEISPRINIDYAGEAAGWPLRFTAKNSAWLSVR